MSDMLKVFVLQELDNQIKANYPHMQYPPCIYAKVVKAEGYSGKYICTLKILDKNRQADSRFPEVPMVATEIEVQKDDIVVVLLLYGECAPYIIGRCG